ncbi:glycosyltransferase family 4 protein [Aureimonas sp. AU4]|uniref:glycosyltransferase n=1 Tax=Aureimonas sp. AU4 TaxID=1638163 RepID=UPI000785EC56|nr:glycosyltransferase family 4 protein [Aureimonas sp. AU4]
MRALFVSSWLPEAQAATGFEIANRAIARGLEACGVELVPVGFRRPGAEAPRGPHLDLGPLAIENSGASRARKAAWVVRALRLGLTVSSAKLRVVDDATLRRRLDAVGQVDAVILSSVQMPIAYPLLTGIAPTVLIAHNVEHLSARENAVHARSPVSRLLYAREARLLERGEAWLCREAAVVHTLAQDDARRLGLEGDPRAVTLSLATGRERGAGTNPGEPRVDVAMIGTWSWAPNRVGMDWFLQEVVPRLPPDVTIEIAGVFDGPPPAAPPQVRFRGRVPDAADFVRSSRVVAIATRGGTGVQLKTIETLEEGMPAVATPAALRGIGAVLPANVRVADDAASFAGALAALVAAVRAGEVRRLDGGAFAQRQNQGLLAGLSAGLSRLRPEASAAGAWDGRERRRRGVAA